MEEYGYLITPFGRGKTEANEHAESITEVICDQKELS